MSISQLDLLDPKNDYVFKRLFAEAPTLLAALINDVRSDEPPIEVIEVLNPRIEPEEMNGKFIVLDILVRDQYDRRYNIRHYWKPQETHLLSLERGSQE